MNLKSKFFFLVIGVIALGSLLVIPIVKGTTQQRTSSTIADKDTYVDTANPLSNYGGVNYLWCGFGLFADIREAFFHFSFTDKPSNITKAELSLDIFGVSQTMVLTLSVINANWDELTMDWTNKPSYGQYIGQFTVSSSDIYKIDLTNLLTPRTSISICVNMTIDDYVDDYVYITSREGYILSSDAPQIIWTYLVDVPDLPAISGYDIIIIFGSIFTIGVFLTSKSKRKKITP